MGSAQPSKDPLVVTCKDCGHANTFAQPYPYHAGFGDQGFLYNEAGNCTLTWSVYDPFFRSHFDMRLWPPRDKAKMRALEEALPLSPKGDRWSFSAVARCGACRKELLGSMETTVHYLRFPDSVELERPGGLWMEFYIKNRPN